MKRPASNRNWSLIALLLAFIVGYEWFVIRPQMKKQIEAAQSSGSAAVPVTPESPASPSSPTTSVVGSSAMKITPELRTEAHKLSLGPSRFVRVFPNGAIGDAELGDYADRIQPNEPVRLDRQAWIWTSSEPSVAQCLGALSLQPEVSSEGSFVFAASLPTGARCQVSYRGEENPNKAGLVHVEAQLSGFGTEQGHLEFKTRDNYGKALNTQDHHYLGYEVDGSQTWVKEKDLLEKKDVQGRFNWIAWGDKYFGTLLMPRGQFNPNLFHVASGEGDDGVAFGIRYPLTAIRDATTPIEFNLYIGTRSPQVLTAIDPDLVRSVDFGWFGSVARALLWLLKKVHLLVGNWGVSIVILTLFVRLAFWPLNKKVYSSGQKMKLLQPELERIKSKYGNDRSKMEQMNREVMDLYKRYKVNPLGGCLPILAQMPIFIGLWSALSHSIELYQTQFLWIGDLSSKDPFYIFPVLWTVTLLVYARLTPQPQSQPGMPDMKWVMIIMNLVFGFLSKDWPAGLTLYLFVSNLVGITQQWLFQRASKLQPIREGV